MKAASLALAVRMVTGAPVPVLQPAGGASPAAAPALAAPALAPASALPVPAAAPVVAPAAVPVAAVPLVAPAPAAEPKASLTALAAAKHEAAPIWDGAAARSAASAPELVAPPPGPARPPRAGLKKAAKTLLPLAGVVTASAVIDIGVVEVYLQQMHRNLGIPWSYFETEVLGNSVLKWWLYFVPATGLLLTIVGWLAARWHGIAAGLALFATGWEDILYYWLRGSSLPDGLGWLDINPFISWTRLLTGTESITSTGLLISAATGLAAALALLARRRVRP